MASAIPSQHTPPRCESARVRSTVPPQRAADELLVDIVYLCRIEGLDTSRVLDSAFKHPSSIVPPPA